MDEFTTDLLLMYTLIQYIVVSVHATEALGGRGEEV
jgi:hypothetical protein